MGCIKQLTFTVLKPIILSFYDLSLNIILLIIKMFRRLNQQNITNKNQSTPLQNPRSKSQKTRNKSYSSIRKKQLNNSELFDYEIAWIHDHLYQGCYYNNKKHGEGIVILNNGLTLIGNWQNGLLKGYALIVTPFGAKIHANYLQGFLQGWAILQYCNSFEIVKFSHDQPQSTRRRYDQFQELWTEALYLPNGKFMKVLKIQKTKDFKLPSFAADPDLIKLYDKIIMKGESNLKKTKIKTIKINDKFQYYGYLNSQQIPNGLGVIYSFNELYAGNFKSGSLDEKGLILFENGLVYKGQIYAGKIWGDGVIYDVNMDQTKLIRVCQQGIEQVLEQQEGCRLDKISFQIGKAPKMPLEKGFSMQINILGDQSTKYYYKSTSSFNSVSNPQTNLEQTQQKPYERQRYFRSNLKKTQIQQFSDSGQLSDSDKADKQNRTKTEKSISSLSSNRKNSFKSSKKREGPIKKQDSLQFSDQQIQNIPIIQSIPSGTPSFDQISKSIKPKVLYPYLLQFQMNKVLISPRKLQKVGKIISNYLKNDHF